METIRPVLGKNNLFISWSHPRHEAGQVIVECLVSHVLGHQERSGEISLPIEMGDRMNPAQRVGSHAHVRKAL